MKLSKNPSNQKLEVIQEAREEDNMKSNNVAEVPENLRLQETPSMTSLNNSKTHQPMIIPSSQVFQQKQLA